LTVVKEILAAAEELPILSKMAIEQSAGSWLGLFDNYNQRLIDIANDMRELKEEESAS